VPAPTTALAAPTAAATPAPAAAKPKYGGTFRRLVTGSIPSMDVHQVAQLSLHYMGPGIAYSRLVQFKADHSVKPEDTVPTGDLAERWEQPDDATYLFKLRPGARWHNIAPVNGRPVVADDVKYSYERQLALKVNAGWLPKFDKVEVVDPQTLKISLPKPDADFLVSLAATYNRIVPRESVEVKGDLQEGPIIGSGPWIFEKWEKGNLVALVRNPDYYLKGVPYVDRIELYQIADVATQLSAFRTKALDMLSGTSLTAKDAETIQKSDPDAVAEYFRQPQGIWMNMNATKPPLNDIRVRQAIFKAIDKQQIIDTVFQGRGWYFIGVPMPSVDYYLPQDEVRAAYKQDLATAQRLLAQASLPPDLELELYTLSVGGSTTWKDAAELIQANLAKVGLKSRIRLSEGSPPWAAAMYQTGAYDIGIGSTTPVSANGDLFGVYHGSAATRNAGRAKDPELDALIEKQATLVKDPEGRRRILAEIQRAVLNSPQAIYLLGYETPVLRWKYLQDFFFAQNIVTDEAYPLLWLDK
jgi:peptide/nickel transport system substrate-binding protein